MKKTKILTILGVMLAMGLTACGGGTNKESSKPAGGSSQQQGGGSSQQAGGSSQQQTGSSQQAGGSSQQAAPQKDQTGHIWGADVDVPASGEGVAYKKATCTENDGAVKLTIDQSAVTLDAGSSRKSGTPDGYLKLDGSNQTARFKFNYDKIARAKLYLYCCMDGWSSNSSKKAFSYNSKPNIGVTVNGMAVDIAALSDVVYTDFLSGTASDYSDDGYGLLGEVALQKGINEVSYTRLASMNTLVKHFVFVAEKEFDQEETVTDVAATATSIAYKKTVNNLSGEVKLEWKSLDGTFATDPASSNKNGTPDGYLKLAGNNQSISYAIDFDENLDGQIYQRGAMDNYSSNQTRTYYSQQSGAKHGNFEMKVNGTNVYFGDKKDVTYLDLLGNGTNETLSGYSEVKDCLIGDAFIKNGANAISFKRLDSFNLAISDFVFIGKKAAAHTLPAADAAYDGVDEISHWQKVGEDSFKFNRADHELIADEEETDTTSTCAVKGVKHYKCSVCGKKVTEELPLAEHTWDADPDKQDVVATTCDGHGIHYEKCTVCGATREVETPSTADHAWTEGTPANNSDGKAVTPLECSGCHKVGAKMSIDDYSSAQFDKDSDKTPGAIRPSQGKAIVYKVIVSKAGTYVLNFGFLCKSNGGVAMSQRRLAVSVGDAAQKMLIDETKTPDALGMNGTTPVQLDIAEVTLAEGENTISLVCASYRLHYSGILRVVEK